MGMKTEETHRCPGRPTGKATREVFALMSDGKARRVVDVAFDLGLARPMAYEALRSLCKQRVTVAMGIGESRHYALTEKGLERAGRTDVQVLTEEERGKYTMGTQKTKQAARLILEGSARSVAELAQVTGWPENVAKNAMASLHSRRLIEPEYRLTAEGMEWVNKVPEPKKSDVRSSASRVKASRAEALRAGARIIERDEPSVSAQTIVQSALANPHPLHSAWGGAHG